MISMLSNWVLEIPKFRISKPVEIVNKITKISALALALLALSQIQFAEARDTCLDACQIVCLELGVSDCSLRCNMAKIVADVLLA